MLFQTVFTTAALVGSAIGLALPRSQETRPSSHNPAQERVIRISPFQISNLTAGVVALSHRNFVNFDVTPSPSLPPVRCQALGTTPGKVLSSISRTWCFSLGSNATGDEYDEFNPPATATTPPTSEVWWFSWTMQKNNDDDDDDDDNDDNRGGAELRVGRQLDAHCREEAVHFIPREEMPVVGTDTMFERQVYTGPERFQVEAWRYEEVES
ncbi:hypothetical protein MMYC01_208910 [Madurella mycetomatis]|uniref:Uncharacterized protein n=1 Tax=Madurella mycetomatis TaxID=100816 RepID=A0A175VTP7_9PEZI|nr:hypothetical protein MMYC01_208910 [Madurella mycetomatis]